MNGIAGYVDIKLMGREFRIACPPEQKEELFQAVALLDGKMQELLNKTRTAQVDKVAVMAALNIAHDLITLQKQPSFDSSGAKRRIEDMGARLAVALDAPAN
ncbi:MAG: hypothetical protein RIR00_1308 [Pseudomonadota bacterium]|jgi:cell division protein ZapA